MPALALPDPPLRGERVALRGWRDSDATAIAAACRDPEIPRWTVIPHRYTEQNALEFLSGRDAALRSGRELALAVVGDSDPTVLGAVGMSNFDWTAGKGEIGYWIAREARGRGAATQAVRLLSAWALDELGLERVELLVNPENTASLLVAERAGFTREGLLERYRRRHGVPEDLVMFARAAAQVES